MTRAAPTLLVAASVVALLATWPVTAGHAQAPQGGPGGGTPGAPGGRAGGGGLAPASLMQTPPKPAIANAKPVRSCESLATVALPKQATRRDQDTTRTRPLCQYPQVAKYKGSGSTNDAASFSCNNGF